MKKMMTRLSLVSAVALFGFFVMPTTSVSALSDENKNVTIEHSSVDLEKAYARRGHLNRRVSLRTYRRSSRSNSTESAAQRIKRQRERVRTFSQGGIGGSSRVYKSVHQKPRARDLRNFGYSKVYRPTYRTRSRDGSTRRSDDY